jgi:hypothetical protein
MELDHTQKYICEYKKYPPKFCKVTVSTSEFAKFSTKSAFDELTIMVKDTFNEMPLTKSKFFSSFNQGILKGEVSLYR